MPPLTEVICKAGSYINVCSGDISLYYITDPLGSMVVSNIYTDPSGLILAPANYYMLFDGSIAYEWDGAIWTGNTKNC
jgi:hypothetical protein